MANYYSIYKVHIADGFADDCEELIHQCTKLETVTYQSFSDIWKEMNVGSLYQGRQSGPELAELTEEAIQIAKHYMIVDTSNFEETVTGLFIVYALLTLQPFANFASLRLVPEDVQAITRIEAVARREKRYDVLYVLGTILVKHSHYLAAERERGLELPLRKYLEGSTSIDKMGVRPKGVFLRQNEELDIIRELNNLDRRYLEAKSELIDKTSNDRSLSYVAEEMPKELETSIKKVISGLIEDEEEDIDIVAEPLPQLSESFEKRQAIKFRAMRQTVDGIKHLTAVSDRPASKSPKKSGNSPKTKHSGKIKSGSPQKPLITSSPKKRRAKPKKTKSKKQKTDDDLDLNAFSKDTNVQIELIDDMDVEIVEDDDILEIFKKPIVKEKRNCKEKTVKSKSK